MTIVTSIQQAFRTWYHAAASVVADISKQRVPFSMPLEFLCQKKTSGMAGKFSNSVDFLQSSVLKSGKVLILV